MAEQATRASKPVAQSLRRLAGGARCGSPLKAAGPRRRGEPIAEVLEEGRRRFRLAIGLCRTEARAMLSEAGGRPWI
jgi:hypothetical protein